jgi:Amt family ammonium transporter
MKHAGPARIWIFLLAASMACFSFGTSRCCASAPAGPAATAAQRARGGRAPEAPRAAGLQPADTVLVLVCASLTLLLIPAVGLFYGGMVRRKNVLALFQQSFVLLGVVSIQWIIVGYSLSFSPDVFGGLCGGLRYSALRGVGLEPSADLAPTIPHQLFATFQMLVAVFTPALISGAIAERMKFSAYLVFSLLWTTLVYDPVAHWVWSRDGWIRQHGALDFGGGLVVHLTAGLAALSCALVLGKRIGLDTEDLQPHNLTLTAIGTGLLWFGWLGLTTGQALAANATAANAFSATLLAGAAGILTWGVLDYVQKRKVTMLGTCTGAVAGLVAVTPAAGYVTPVGAFALGVLVCPLCYGAIAIKGRLGHDDSLDVFGVHGVGGLAGVLGVGVLAAPGPNGGPGGLLTGKTELLLAQAIAVGAVALYTIVVTIALLLLIDRTVGLRVSWDEEELGLDLTQHGQRGYIMGERELIGVEPR